MNDESSVYYDLEGKAWRIKKRGKNKIWIRDPTFDGYDLKEKLISWSPCVTDLGMSLNCPKNKKMKEKKENE